MNNYDSKGWISCVVILVIMALAFAFLRSFGWIIFPVIIIVNLVRGLLWRQKIIKAQKQAGYRQEEYKHKNTRMDSERYCEAEFEILDDEPEENK